MSDQALDHALVLLAEATRPGNRASLPELNASQIEQLRSYLEILLLWRQRSALISTADPLRLVQHHILDSLHVTPHLSGCSCLADVGSGAGFPGIPLAVALPEVRVCLFESRRKKANFLREVRRGTELENLEVIEGRAEGASSRTFDAVTARALGSVEAFLRLSAGLLRSGGLAIAMRGPGGSDESIRDLNFDAPRQAAYQLAEARERILLIYQRL